ncbi:MAG TPA: hypothetical protein VIR16_02500 [Candidatus Limnocylindrales bacterium]
MAVYVHLEHPVPDYDAWKAAFDSDPLDRRASGVVAYRILRPVDDEGRVAVDLEFADREAAERFRSALLRLWTSGGAMAVMRDPVVRVEAVAEAARV